MLTVGICTLHIMWSINWWMHFHFVKVKSAHSWHKMINRHLYSKTCLNGSPQYLKKGTQKVSLNQRMSSYRSVPWRKFNVLCFTWHCYRMPASCSNRCYGNTLQSLNNGGFFTAFNVSMTKLTLTIVQTREENITLYGLIHKNNLTIL